MILELTVRQHDMLLIAARLESHVGRTAIAAAVSFPEQAQQEQAEWESLVRYLEEHKP